MNNTEEKLPASFDELIRTHELPILVDFWAEWCGPCRMMTPVLSQLASEMKGKLTVIKINTDEKPALAAKYGISSIPTMILFKEGKEAGRTSGAMNLESLKKKFALS
ncbi:MAG TPA: thioredoxin [Leptospiraceae bacterium]|nr:thioredoxin [Leptospiraceae bacterium]HMY66376.1 thioredoxin [Leptospiraceae bacterium]HMZ58562.1 thioredoxin [Leptospiraceae bacterium]HNF12362.1 thioredoxin [Leptospiraceae bacterium]HNF23835.1 thioredoxin [Leptospiraceae bacterium]